MPASAPPSLLHLGIDCQATRDRSRLPLVLTSSGRTVGALGRARHRMEDHLRYAHSRVKLHRAATQISQLKGDFTIEPRVDETRGSMNHDGNTTDTAPSLDARDKVTRDAHALNGTSKSELSRMKHESCALFNNNLIGIARDRFWIPRINTRDMGQVVDDETVSEPQVDTRRLDLELRIVERINPNLAP